MAAEYGSFVNAPHRGFVSAENRLKQTMNQFSEKNYCLTYTETSIGMKSKQEFQ